MLSREVEAKVLEFCAAQRDTFAAGEWLPGERLPVSARELATVALYLAGGDWYGHHEELELVAETLQPGCVGYFTVLAKETRFDCGRFGNMLKVKVGVK